MLVTWQLLLIIATIVKQNMSGLYCRCHLAPGCLYGNPPEDCCIGDALLVMPAS